MAGRIVYLESDDEITTAAARVRAADASRIAVVLPYGSRLATSRINFRLLSRDALTHEKRVSIVSGDPATRALAASAGLPVFASVAEYESSSAGWADEPDAASAGPDVAAQGVLAAASAVPGGQAPVVPPVPTSDGTLGLEVAPVAAAGASAVSGSPGDTVRTPVSSGGLGPYDRRPGEPTARPRGPSGTFAPTGVGLRGGIRTPWLIGGAILALAVLVGGVGAYVLLPSATIVVTPRPERIALIPLTVVADTTATQPDPTRGVVPADLISIPVSVNDTFKATGMRVALTKATGTVRFENLDPTSTNRIDAGSIVRTDSGVRFRTDVTITVPSGNLVADPRGGIKDIPGTASVKVTAVDGGPDGNVDARKVNHVPSGETSPFLSVTNPEATTGGLRQEFTRVTQPDVDGALAALNLSLQQAFVEAMADPSLATGGATVFPSTGTLAEPTPDIPPDTLVGQEVPTFALTLSATGTVIAVDAAPVSAIADTQLRAAVRAGHELVDGSVGVEVGEAVVVGRSVSFPVTASAQQVALLDPEALKTAVLGKPIAEARAILEAYGKVDLAVSPDWTGSVPGFASRVTVNVSKAVSIQTPSPTPTAATPSGGPARPSGTVPP